MGLWYQNCKTADFEWICGTGILKALNWYLGIRNVKQLLNWTVPSFTILYLLNGIVTPAF